MIDAPYDGQKNDERMPVGKPPKIKPQTNQSKRRQVAYKERNLRAIYC